MDGKKVQQLWLSILASAMGNSCTAPSNGTSLSVARPSVHGVIKTFSMAPMYPTGKVPSKAGTYSPTPFSAALKSVT